VETKVLLGRQVLVDRRILKDESDPTSHLCLLSDDVGTRDSGVPRGWAEQRAEHRDRRRLPAPFGPRKPNVSPG
jgi:hypothetical protein